jgi:hypothetical protein
MLKKLKNTLLTATLLISSASVFAAPITFLDADDNVSSLAEMVNSSAALNDFLAVTGSIDSFGFETSIPANLTVTGGSIVSVGSCGALCGFNTTAGGSNFVELSGGSVTFSFTQPIDAFGFFVNGLQTDRVAQQFIEYVDGSMVSQIINMPSAIDGGGAFVGFVDFGESISSVTFDASFDILGFDDLLFGRSENDPNNPVSAPSVLMLLVASMIGLRLRRKK